MANDNRDRVIGLAGGAIVIPLNSVPSDLRKRFDVIEARVHSPSLSEAQNIELRGELKKLAADLDERMLPGRLRIPCFGFPGLANNKR